MKKFCVTPNLEKEKIMPSTEVEKTIYDIFKEVLNVKSFSIKDDFFKLGGDSILAMQVVSKAKKAKYSFSVRDLFANPSVWGLSQIAQEISIESDNLQEVYFELSEEDMIEINKVLGK